jgi:hypothetical protein
MGSYYSEEDIEMISKGVAFAFRDVYNALKPTIEWVKSFCFSEKNVKTKVTKVNEPST